VPRSFIGAYLPGHKSLSAMPRKQNIYHQLLQKGFSKRDIHSALHKAMMLQIQQDKASGGKHTSLHKKTPYTLYHKPFPFFKV
jgi:hypothetical protein